jgi:hypothetical protein
MSWLTLSSQFNIYLFFNVQDFPVKAHFPFQNFLLIFFSSNLYITECNWLGKIASFHVSIPFDIFEKSNTFNATV